MVTISGFSADEGEQSPLPSVLSFDRALKQFCSLTLAAIIGDDLTIELDVQVEAGCPEPPRHIVSRIVDELLCNAVEHAFYSLQRGRVCVRVERAGPDRIAIRVSDDGWGFGDGPIIEGNGFHLLRMMGVLQVGASRLPSVRGATVSVVLADSGCGWIAAFSGGPSSCSPSLRRHAVAP